MITKDALVELGVNTAEGIARCMNNETFYLKMVDMALRDKGYDRLLAALERDDLDDAFEAAHALKGVLANLSLTPLLVPVVELTELLRARRRMDYTPYINTIREQRERFNALLD